MCHKTVHQHIPERKKNYSSRRADEVYFPPIAPMRGKSFFPQKEPKGVATLPLETFHPASMSPTRLRIWHLIHLKFHLHWPSRISLSADFVHSSYLQLFLQVQSLCLPVNFQITEFYRKCIFKVRQQ